MKPHQKCKAGGLKSLAELSKITKVCIQTLISWSSNKPELFNIVIIGAYAKKRDGLRISGGEDV